MHQKLLLIITFILLAYTAKGQSLGNYPISAVKSGGNTTVHPVSAPLNTVKMSVSTSTKFTGVLTANSLTGIVSVTDAKPSGTYTIIVRAFSSTGAYTTKTFPLIVHNPSCSQGEFTGHTELSTARAQFSVVIGDFNNDGKQDLATAHLGLNTISIRMGDGMGGFTTMPDLIVGSHPYGLAVGDFNRDGFQDIASVNAGGNHVSILIGNGNGTFYPNPVVVVGSSPVNDAIGDFNSDGKQDLAVANLHSNTVSIRLGDGLGGFAGNIEIPVGTYPEYVAIGDFNGDGFQDLVTANGGYHTLSVRLGNGGGNFSGNTEVPVGSNPYCVAIGDFNGDGRQDLASANFQSNTVSIRLGDGHGNFSGTTEIPVGNNPYWVAIGNFNGDPFLDIAVTNYTDNTVSIRLGDGTGNFNGTNEINVGSYPIGIAVGEFNGDTKEDLAVSDYYDQTISIRLGIDSTPIVVYATNSSPVCEGGDLVLNALGGVAFSWTGPNGFTSSLANPTIHSATLSDSGVYSVTITTIANCTATTSTSVRMNPLPVVTFTLPVDTMCNNDPVTGLTGGSPATGFYSGTGVLPGNLFDPSQSGSGADIITYSYTDSNDCENSDQDTMFVLICEGVNENENTNILNVYPNPVKEEFKIDLSSVRGNNKITLFTSEGKLVREWNVSGNDSHIFSMKGFSNGFYFLRLATDDSMEQMRIVKQE